MIGDTAEILNNYGGLLNNDLNAKLNYMDDIDSEHQNSFPRTTYIDTEEVVTFLKNNKNKVTMFSLNCQSINAKFSKIELLIHYLRVQGLFFDILCFQECWLDGGTDTNMFILEDYNMIFQEKKCCGHGGLITYVRKNYSYKKMSFQNTSDIWEGLFVDISRPELTKNIIISNIYRPPKFNNNNTTIRNFIDEITPVLNNLQSKSCDVVLAGDFNIDLLKINERELYGEFFDLMLSCNFFPQISLPSRFSKKNASLLDQIFVKNSFLDRSVSSAILFNDISDHLGCISEIGYLNNKYKPVPKYVTIRKRDENSLINFREAIASTDLLSKLDHSSDSDPNKNYDIIHNAIQTSIDEHLPTKTVRFNRYKHKNSKWITSGLLKSIQFRDKLYKKFHKSKPGTENRNNLQLNLRTFNSILKKSIHMAKSDYYHTQLNKYKKDTRKTWDTLKDILNKNKNSKHSHLFTKNNKKITHPRDIAEGFNEHFSSIIGNSGSDVDKINGYKRY